MTCRFTAFGPTAMMWECSVSRETYGLALYNEQVRQYELSQDLEIERELGRWPRMTPEFVETESELVDAVFAIEGAAR